MELNPNHATTRAVSDQWHKLCAILMVKFGVDHVVIRPQDIMSLMGGGVAITVQELEDGMHLRIIDQKLADGMARNQGGLPS